MCVGAKMDRGFGKYDVYTVSGSIYCYRDTNVLKNRFGLRDGEKLKKVEADLSVIRQNDLLSHPIRGRFTANHLCRIHRYLLGDLYPFAGHFRREDIMKGTTRFLAHQEIKTKLSMLLGALREEHSLLGFDFETLIERSAYYFAELNYIHPFREGNGRATREFMRQLYAHNGYAVNWAAVPTEDFLAVMETSVFDTTQLKERLRICLYPYDTQETEH